MNNKSSQKSYLLALFLIIFMLGNASTQANNNVKSLEIITAKNIQKENSSIGMNLNSISDWSTEYPFIDFVKQSRRWIANRRGRKWGDGGQLIFDKYGWVKSLNSDQRAELVLFQVHKNVFPYKKFRVMYRGEGIIQYRGHVWRSETKRIGMFNVHNIIVDIKRNGPVALMIIKTNPNNYIRDISVVPIQFTKLHDEGEIFNPDWISYIKQFRTIRFMNWMKTTELHYATWNNRPLPSDYTWSIKGVPIEIMVKLANKLHSEPWFNIPHTADDTYIRNFAKYVSENLQKDLRVYIEHSNEVWNPRFEATHYAQRKGKQLWGIDVKAPIMQWQGMRTAKICQIWKNNVFRAERERVVCVLALQPGNPDAGKFALDCPAFASTNKQKCYKYGIDAIAITGYFSGCLNGISGWQKPRKDDLIRSWFSDPDKGISKAFEQIAYAKYFECNKSLPERMNIYQKFSRLAKARKLLLFAYEGGQHVTGNGAGRSVMNDKAFIDFHLSINRDKRMYNVYIKNFENWKSAGGALFLHYNDISPYSKFGSWGAIEYLGQETSPKYEAIRDFNKSIPCWWENCSLRSRVSH